MDQIEIKILIKDLRKGGSIKERATRKLYLFLKKQGTEKLIFHQIRNLHGNVEDARDLFHESFIILIEKLEAGDHMPEFNVRNYLLGISKYLWKNKAYKLERVIMVEDFNGFEDWESVSCDGEVLFKEKKILVRKLLDQLDKKCKKILGLWMNSFKMEEIAESLSLSSEKMARKYKYRCHKKLVQSLSKQPEIVRELMN